MGAGYGFFVFCVSILRKCGRGGEVQSDLRGLMQFFETQKFKFASIVILDELGLRLDLGNGAGLSCGVWFFVNLWSFVLTMSGSG